MLSPLRLGGNFGGLSLHLHYQQLAENATVEVQL